MDYKTLKQQIRYHNILYYEKAAPILTDAEYNQLYDQLIALEKSQGYRDYDSPSVLVGSIDYRQGVVRHPNRLYSLDKVYDPEKVNKRFTIKTPKLDGAGVVNHYNHGESLVILSRGNGIDGENISFLIKDLFKDVKIEKEEFLGKISISCEAITFQKVDNYRNYVAGALNLKDKDEFLSRQIELVVHDVLGVELPYTERLEYIHQLGMMTVLHDQEKLKAIPQDGWVFRTNEYELEKQLGYTSKHPRFAVALKQRETATATTILKEVIWAIGRTGTVNPTGIVDPVIIGGATVSRLTLHNIAFIEANDICIGDRIKIERAGEIIPTFVSVEEKSPVRQKITEQNAEEGTGVKVIRTGPKLFVADKSVNDRKAILHYAELMNIQGLGPSSIEKLGLNHISDLYREQPWDILGVNGKKIAQEIEYSKTKAYENVLAGLGIPGVGLSLARKIVQVIPNFDGLAKIEDEKIEKIGPKITDKIITWYEDNSDWVKKLPVQLVQTVDTLSTKRTVCITGKLDMPRKELAQHLENVGFEVLNSVTKSLYVLITDGKIESDKTQKAAKYGVRIVNYFDKKSTILAGTF